MDSGSQPALSELNTVDDIQSDAQSAQIVASHNPSKTVPCNGAVSLMGVVFNNLRWSHVTCCAEEDD